jgi:hypothetical protein
MNNNIEKRTEKLYKKMFETGLNDSDKKKYKEN